MTVEAPVERRAARIGVFGGSFNPPHLGHEELVRSILDRDLVDELRIVPVYEHPFGKELAPFADRLEMCRLAFGPLGPRVRIEDLEARLGGRSYTVRTLEELHRRRPGDELVLVIGADALRDAQSWRSFERIREIARLLVVPRHGERAFEEALEVPAPLDVSSTEVRRRIARGEPIAGLVSPAVESYLGARGLYRGDAVPDGGGER